MGNLESSFYVPGQSLVKYGKKEEMYALFEQGEVYLQAASEFDKEELDRARRDQELCREWSGKVQVEEQVIWPCVDAACRLTSQSGYYMYCLSKELDSSLFRVLDRDACVIFHWGWEFCNTCCRTLVTHQTGAIAWANDVSYYDPHDIRATNVFHFTEAYKQRLSRQMRYTREQFDLCAINRADIHNVWLRKPKEPFECQQEYRIVLWGLFCLEKDKAPITLRLGSLKSRAALFEYSEKSGLVQLS
jgi:hypothetical protein